MRYLQSFHWRLREARSSRHFTRAELASVCGVEETLVAAWEAPEPGRRQYPDVAALMNLCQRLDVALETLLDPEELGAEGQLELPGLRFTTDADLTRALGELETEIERHQPSGEETELLRRFRKTSPENRRMIMQLLGR